MPSAPLKRPDELRAYIKPDSTAHLVVFFNTPTKAFEYLVVVFGATPSGGIGELAHLPMPKDVFDRLTEQYPVSNKTGLLRSEDFSVDAAYDMLLQYWPPPAPVSESVPE